MKETPPPNPVPTVESFERHGVEPVPENLKETPHPGTLDIIRIDGRWAQNAPGGGWIKFLDAPNLPILKIDWNQYKLVKKYGGGVSIGYFKEVYTDQITDEQISRAHYSDTEKGLSYSSEIHLFGEYERKENIT